MATNELQRLLQLAPNDPQWNPRVLCVNPNISEGFLQTLGDNAYHQLFNITTYSANPNLTWDEISRLPFRGWNLNSLLRMPCVTTDILLHHFRPPTLLSRETSGWTSSMFLEMSANPNVTMDFVMAHLELPWSVRGLSYNPSITWTDTRRKPEWEWVQGGFETKCTYEELEAMHRDTGRKISLLTVCLHNPWIRWRHVVDPKLNYIFDTKYVMDGPQQNVSYATLARIVDIPFAFIKRWMHHHITTYGELLEQGWMTPQKMQQLHAILPFITSNDGYPSTGYYWSRWPHLTAEFVQAHPEINWCKNSISNNSLKKGPRIRMWAALTIQNGWKGWKTRRVYARIRGWHDIHRDLLYLPGVGVLYKEAMSSYEFTKKLM